MSYRAVYLENFHKHSIKTHKQRVYPWVRKLDCIGHVQWLQTWHHNFITIKMISICQATDENLFLASILVIVIAMDLYLSTFGYLGYLWISANNFRILKVDFYCCPLIFIVVLIYIKLLSLKSLFGESR